jgi:hypothetical protein
MQRNRIENHKGLEFCLQDSKPFFMCARQGAPAEQSQPPKKKKVSIKKSVNPETRLNPKASCQPPINADAHR